MNQGRVAVGVAAPHPTYDSVIEIDKIKDLIQIVSRNREVSSIHPKPRE
jgi:hypothetical protein